MRRKIFVLAIFLAALTMCLLITPVQAETEVNLEENVIVALDFEDGIIGNSYDTAATTDNVFDLNEGAAASEIIVFEDSKALKLTLNGFDNRLFNLNTDLLAYDTTQVYELTMKVRLNATNSEFVFGFDFVANNNSYSYLMVKPDYTLSFGANGAGITYETYDSETGILSFRFRLSDTFSRNTFILYMNNYSGGDEIIIDDFKIKTAPVFSVDFENYAIGNYPVDTIANVYFDGAISANIVEVESKALEFLVPFFPGEGWPNGSFYLNRLDMLTGEREYSLSFDYQVSENIDLFYIDYGYWVDGAFLSDVLRFDLRASVAVIEKSDLNFIKDFQFDSENEQIMITFKGVIPEFKFTVKGTPEAVGSFVLDNIEINILPVATGLELDTTNLKKEYVLNEAELDFSGLKVYLAYSNHAPKQLINLEDCELIYEEDWNTTFGVKTVTVKYGEFEAAFTISVILETTADNLKINLRNKVFKYGEMFVLENETTVTLEYEGLEPIFLTPGSGELGSETFYFDDGGFNPYIPGEYTLTFGVGEFIKTATVKVLDNENLLYYEDFENLDLSDSINNATGLVWAGENADYELVDHNGSKAVKYTVIPIEGNPFTRIGGLGDANFGNLAKLVPGNAYKISMYFEMNDKFEFIYVDYDAGDLYGSFRIYPDGTIAGNDQKNIMDIRYDNATKRLSFTVVAEKFNKAEDINSFIKFVGFNAREGAVLYLDEVKIWKSEYVYFHNFSNYSLGSFSFQVDDDRSFIWRDASVAEIISVNGDKKLKFTNISKGEEGVSFGYFNRWQFTTPGRDYRVEFEYEALNMTKLWIFYDGSWAAGNYGGLLIDLVNKTYTHEGNEFFKEVVIKDGCISLSFTEADKGQIQFIGGGGEAGLPATFIFDNISFTALEKEIEELTLDLTDVETEYFAGDEFIGLAGLKAGLRFTDGSFEELYFGYDLTIDPLFDINKAGIYEVIVSYLSNRGNLITASFNIEVNAVEEIGFEIDSKQVTKIYEPESELDFSNLIVYVLYNNGTKEILTSDAYTIDTSLFDNTLAGTYPIYVSYKDYPTQAFEVTVTGSAIVSFRIDHSDVQKTFPFGSEFAISNLKVYLIYADESEEEIRDGYVLTSDFDGNNPGVYTVYVSYGKFEALSFEVVVTNNIVDYEFDFENLKTDYRYGEDFSTVGMKLYAIRENGSKEEVTDFTVEVKGYSKSLLGSQNLEIIVTIGTETYQDNLEIIVSRPIKEIEVDTSLLPEKVIRGSEVDLSGLKVKLSYADDLENNIVFLSAEDYDISEGVIDPKNLLNYTITYLDPYTKEVATANFSIKTVIVIGIRVDLSTSKTEYQYGESLSLAGLSVYQIFDDETEALLQEGDYEINFGGYSANEPGEYQITITYQEFTENFKVKVLARQVESLRLSLAEIKTTYQAGETFDLSGLRVYAVYADASEERLSEGDYTVDESEFDNTKAGEYKIKVSYGGKTAEFTVTVQVAKKGCRSFFGTSFALSLGLLASVFFVLRRRK